MREMEQVKKSKKNFFLTDNYRRVRSSGSEKLIRKGKNEN